MDSDNKAPSANEPTEGAPTQGEQAVVRKFTPPNNFRAKVPATGGITLEEMQKRADVALAKLEEESGDWMQADVERLASELAAAANAEPAAVPRHVHEISKITHDLKSMAAQFAYPMIGRVGESLCDFITTDADLAAQRLDVIRVHVDAIVVILANGLSGDGGDAGAHLLEALRKAVSKARAQQEAGAEAAI